MGNPNTYDAAIAAELNKFGEEIRCARYRHERNDEYGWKLITRVEDEIDRLEAELARLEQLYNLIRALLV
jgi:hypothetical protein